MRRFCLVLVVLAWLSGALALAGGDASPEPTQKSASTVVEIDLAVARSGANASEFLHGVGDESADQFSAGVFPENSRYCIEPLELTGECLIDPHTLVLQLAISNKTEDRFLDTHFSLAAPDLELLESRGPWRVPGEGFFDPFTTFRYAPGALEGPHRIEVGILYPGEQRRLNVTVRFPEPERAPDRLRLAFQAQATPIAVEEEAVLTQIAFKQDETLTVPPQGRVPGVSLPSLATGDRGTLSIAEVRSPGLLAELEALPGVQRVAPLYRFRSVGLRRQYDALIPSEVLTVGDGSNLICSAVFYGGQWFLGPSPRQESGVHAIHISVSRYRLDFDFERGAEPSDNFVTLVEATSPASAAAGCTED